MLAAYYHLHHREYDEDLPFWLSLQKWMGQPVLELGCGTGRVLLPSARAGRRVVGVDRDPDMLAVIREALEADGELDVTLIEADFTELELEERFPLIIMPCNTYSTLDAETRRKTIQVVARHLLPGGVFAASLPNPARLARIPQEGEAELEGYFTHPENGNPVQVSSAWQREGAKVKVRWHYDYLKPDGQAERLTSEVLHSLTPADEYGKELASQGFEVSRFGDFEGGPYGKESPYLVLAATRKQA